MNKSTKTNNKDRKIKLLERRIKNREFQRGSIHKCISGKIMPSQEIRNANDKVWDVILFVAINAYRAEPLKSSDIYLGTGVPKRTVIRIIDKLESLNVIAKTADHENGHVTRVGLSDAFAERLDRHLQECLSERI